MIPFTTDMLPIMNAITPINSSAIELSWRSSPTIEGIDLSQLLGTFTVLLSVSNATYFASKVGIYPLTRLNETHQTNTISKLQSNTVYHTCFQSKWHENNKLIDPYIQSLLSRRECRLVRTYMAGKR